MQTFRAPRLAALSAALLLTACADTPEPVAPLVPGGDGEGAAPTALVCTASVQAGTVSCEPASGDGPARALIVGGQGRYVQVSSNDVTVGGGIFAFDVTVQNLIPQSMGTLDGVTPHPDGVRVFFHVLPTVTSGTGTIEVANPDGYGDFTGTNQPYFQYDGILPTNATTEERRWELEFDGAVGTFVFTLYVSTEVQFPAGYVEVSNAPATLVEGEVRTLTGLPRTAVGNPDTAAAAITWSTSDSAVAVIDAEGVLTAVSAGSVTITATSGDRIGEVTLDVCPAMEVGEVFTAAMPLASRLCLPGGEAAAAEYTYMPINLSAAGSISLTTTGTGIVGVTGPPTPSLLPASGLTSYTSAPAPASDAHLARLAGAGRAPSLARAGAGRSGGPSLAIVPGVPTVGDTWTLDFAPECTTTPDERTGQVVSVSANLILVEDVANPAGGFTSAQYDSIAAEFDAIAYPAITENFGEPTDRDGNDRIVAFVTSALNAQSPAGTAATADSYAYFNWWDVLPADSIEGCASSNGGEILYVLAPDPAGSVNGNVRTVASVRENVVRGLGHELQHLVNAHRRAYITGGGPFEEPWLDEALSRVAEELMFYRASGLTPGQNLDQPTLASGPNAAAREEAYFRYAAPKFLALYQWLIRPDLVGPLRANGAADPRTQGVTWAFLRYVADQRGGDQSAFWSSLVDGGEVGLANLEAAIGAPAEQLRNFVTAMYADDAVPGLAAVYTQPSWNFRSIYGVGGATYPLLTRPLINGVDFTWTFARGGATSYFRFGVPSGTNGTITLTSGGAVPGPSVILSVVRTR